MDQAIKGCGSFRPTGRPWRARLFCGIPTGLVASRWNIEASAKRFGESRRWRRLCSIVPQQANLALKGPVL